ncbi:sorting nexin-11 [Solea solea]|uniref:sorting nexin-11 n=1 Tax=Solea solea TaxID=90069 RepID=UPI00272A6D75|nr:sorting nexin-11 [Solea solea]
MNNNQDDEFVAVRVQDPRIQNEGLWNSYVDYKIFLHTNSKAFTAKTSCVRRRYSEFVWLKKKMQKNAGLVPVPNLPGKSLFSFSNEDFLENRRKGLQAFLDKVLHMTVCLSDSQLHLFLQTQLPVGHIQDCVQGHTPYSVTDAILTYASSNWGLAQAQTPEDDSIKDPSLTISYESMESPAPHLPCLQTQETFSPKLLACEDSDPLADLLALCDKGTTQVQHNKKSSVKISQKSHHLKAVVEWDGGSTDATFFLGDSPVEPQSCDLAEHTQQRSGQIQTPVEVHSPMEAGFAEDCVLGSEEEECTESRAEEMVVSCDTEDMQVNADPSDNPLLANINEVTSEPETCETSVVTLDLKYNASEEGSSQEEVFKGVSSDKQILENHTVSEVNHTDNTKCPAVDLSCAEDVKKSDGQIEPSNKDNCEVDLIGSKHERDEDSHSLPSSNESIVQVSDEDSTCDDTEESIQALNGDVSHHILDLHVNGCPVEKEDISAHDDEDLRYMTSLNLNSTEAGESLSESGDISILETNCMPGVAEEEEEAWSSPMLDTSEETREMHMC